MQSHTSQTAEEAKIFVLLSSKKNYASNLGAASGLSLARRQ